MNRTYLAAPVLLLLAACDRDAAGTFVGNPNLTASYEGTARQAPTRGRLRAAEVILEPCSGPSASLGAQELSLPSGRSATSIQFPPGEYCSAFVAVSELVVAFEDAGRGEVRIVARDFDLPVQAPFDAERGDEWTLRLGTSDWLERLAAEADVGTNEVGAGSEGLQQAFQEGLDGSTVAPADADGDPLPGRLDLSSFGASPLGTPTTVDSCGTDTVFDLAVPIPPAAMVTRGRRDIGWCEGSVVFGADLDLRETTGVDYSDLSTFPIAYNGWSQGCDSVHCGTLYLDDETAIERACTVLASCDGDSGAARVTGYGW